MLPVQRISTTAASIFLKRHTLPAASANLIDKFLVRWYRGDSSDMKHRREVNNDKIVKREEALLAIAEPKYEMIHERHIRMPKLEDIPKASLSPDMRDSTDFSVEELELEVRKKRLVYRSKQRGWLEVDLLLGTWASLHVPSLNLDELDQFEAFVNLETIDIYNIITLRTEVPEFMMRDDGTGVVEKIQEWARSSPLGKGEPEKYSIAKKEHNLI